MKPNQDEIKIIQNEEKHLHKTIEAILDVKANVQYK